MGSRRTKTDATRAVAYLRCSTDRQEESPGVQRAAIAAWAEKSGVRILAEHADIAVSGATEHDDRPGLVAALASMREHGAGLLLVQRRDRLGRDLAVVAILERAVERIGGRVVAVDLGDVDGISGVVLRGTLDLLASVERRLIGERTRLALQAKRARGESTNHRRLGESVRNGKVRAHAKEAVALERARVLRERWGKPWRTIATMLDAEHPRPKGARWHARSVMRAVERVAARASGHADGTAGSDRRAA
jgi:DNA invertase Pin-like site-specific DNA recombinase